MRHFVPFYVLAFNLFSIVIGFHTHSAKSRGGKFEVCIDYGSSGPKVFWCPSKLFFESNLDEETWPKEFLNTFKKDHVKHMSKLKTAEEKSAFYVDKAIGGLKIPSLEGGGSFAKMKDETLETLTKDVGDFFQTHFPEAKDGFLLRICRATAGNRFGRLSDDQAPGWNHFNKVLEYIGIIPDKDGACQTIPGTKEATFEYYLATTAFEGKDVAFFIGIGGASMQMKVPDRTCPAEGWSNDLHMGGDGASKDTDYCINFEGGGGGRGGGGSLFEGGGGGRGGGGSLWSFLSDRGDIKHWSKNGFHAMHMVGGMDESVVRFWYSRNQHKGKEWFPFRTPNPTYTRYSLVQETFLDSDQMMVFWRKIVHGGERQCRELPLKNVNVGIMSNMKRFLSPHRQALRNIAKGLTWEGKKHDFQKSTWADWVENVLAVHCGQLVEFDFGQKTEAELGKFQPGNHAFFCGADVYRIGLLEDIIGVNRDDPGKAPLAPKECWMHNLWGLVGDHVAMIGGDWMNGYLVWETAHNGMEADADALSEGSLELDDYAEETAKLE